MLWHGRCLCFEQAHYDVSIKCGERVLLPAVRGATKDTLIITNGFSCREQIAQTTDRQALHLAQVIQMALHEDRNELARAYPEAQYMPQVAQQSPSKVGMAVVMSAAIMLIGGAVTWLLSKRSAR